MPVDTWNVQNELISATGVEAISPGRNILEYYFSVHFPVEEVMT